MGTTLKGTINGAGFGLLAGSVETWLALPRLLQLNLPAFPGLSTQTLLLATALGALLGLGLSPLLRTRRGPGLHVVAVAVAWLALELWAGLEGTFFRVVAVSVPAATLVLVVLGRWIGRKRTWVPTTVAVVVALGAVLTPSVYQAITQEPMPRRTTSTICGVNWSGL